MDVDEISAYLDQRALGPAVKRLVRMVGTMTTQIPYYEVTGELQPVTSSIIRVTVRVQCDFEWTLRMHGPVGEESWRDR